MEITACKLGRFILAAGLIAFLSIVFFGASHLTGMDARSDGAMSGCFFTGMENICTMTFIEHLTAWRSMLTATIPREIPTLALLFLFAIAIIFITIAALKRNLLLLFSYYTTRWRLYIRHNPELSLFNPLKEAFSQGILNPKIY